MVNEDNTITVAYVGYNPSLRYEFGDRVIIQPYRMPSTIDGKKVTTVGGISIDKNRLGSRFLEDDYVYNITCGGLDFLYDKFGDYYVENGRWEADEIIFPETVTKLGYASGLHQLKNLSGLGNVAYFEDSSLHATRHDLNDHQFYYLCETRTCDINLKNAVYIGDYAFFGFNFECLKGIDNMANVEHIGTGAFSNVELKYFKMPNHYIEIEGNPFIGCPMSYIDVSSDNEFFAFDGCCLFDKKTKRIISCLKEGEFYKNGVIPDGVKEIAPYAFQLSYVYEKDEFGKNKVLTEIKLPEGLEKIGRSALLISGLETVYIPESVTYIGKNAVSSSSKIVGKAGSYAEKWAIENGINFSIEKTEQDMSWLTE